MCRGRIWEMNMNGNTELVKQWAEIVESDKLIPICLVTMTEDGVPHVLTLHDPELINLVFKNLVNSEPPKLIKKES
jgi:hypothetical protein